MILRFATDLTVAFTNNQSERDIRPVKVRQRASGGGWRTLEGLADFAVVQSYLSTAAKWGLDSWRRCASCSPSGRGCHQPSALTDASGAPAASQGTRSCECCAADRDKHPSTLGE
jgi:hypothetical protein